MNKIKVADTEISVVPVRLLYIPECNSSICHQGCTHIAYFCFLLVARNAAELKSTYCCMQYADNWDILLCHDCTP